MSENETALTEDEQLVLERYREMDENNKQALIAYFSQASTEVQKTFATFHCLDYRQLFYKLRQHAKRNCQPRCQYPV